MVSWLQPCPAIESNIYPPKSAVNRFKCLQMWEKHPLGLNLEVEEVCLFCTP